MHFVKLDKFLPIESEKDLYVFWLAAFGFRKTHRHFERELANYLYLNSNKAKKLFKFDDDTNDINFEFASLESPGSSGAPGVDQKDYEDRLWSRLESVVNKEFMKRFS